MTHQLRPLIRVLHFSDTHFSQARPHSVYLRRLLNNGITKRFLGHARQQVEQGLRGHSSRALHELRRSVLDFMQQQGNAWRAKTHLVCTGDLSTWGDDPSLARARHFIETLTRDAALPNEACVLYGNHDVWPAKPGHLRGIPAFSTQQTLDVRRTAMRKHHFPGCSWLKSHVTLAGPPRIGLCALNTIEHCRWRNTWARGEVKADVYWEGGNPPSQLDQLESWLGAVDVALVFSHHPVHDDQYHTPPTHGAGTRSTSPPQSGRRPAPVSVIPPSSAPVLLNAAQVGRTLQKTTGGGAPLPVRVMISGHTHRVFPAPGQLPTAGPLDHGCLQQNLGQLTIGTASQSAIPGAAVDHYWQALSLWFDDATQEIVLERIVFRRPNGIGRFQRFAALGNRAATAERLRLPLV